MRDLDELQAGLLALQALGANSRRLERCREVRLSGLFETERAVTRLVEAVHEADVERGGVCSEGKVDIGQCPGMRDLQADGASRRRPLSTVAQVDGFGDVGAWRVSGKPAA